MVIMLSGTPATAGTSSQIDCLDEAGEPFKLVLRVIAPTDSGTANCYLKRYDRDGTCTMLMLPNIQSIEETDTANLAEISTIIYGFDDNFVMDLGTTQRFTVTLKRVQPMPSSDPQRNVGETDAQFWSRVNYAQSANWSNGFWYDALVHFIDGWQNLNYGFVERTENNNTTMQFVQTGGFTFHFEPQGEVHRDDANIYSDLYPIIHKNVFIAGQISMSYSGNNLQYLNISMPLAVSTMIRNQRGQEMRVVRYYLDDESLQDNFEAAYPAGEISSIAPLSVPNEWTILKSGGVFTGWNRITTEASVDPEFYPGALVPYNVEEMYALWKLPKYATFDDASGSDPTIIHISDLHLSNVSAINYILVGHGGAGGKGVYRGSSHWGYGGGGGSGGYKTGAIVLNHSQFGDVTELILNPSKSPDEDTTLTVKYSNGMENTYSVGNGQNGSDSYYGGTPIIDEVLYPGKGGAAGPNGSPGGDATDSAGGVGGDLSQYLNNYSIYYGSGTPLLHIGPFTSTSGNAPAYGGGHDGVNNSRSKPPGAKGLIIISIY